jgi:hypothetical protein
MKECPVCKESFVDDFNFCEIDGTPLDRNVGGSNSVGSTSGGSNRIWSFVGVALLLGAVFLSALSIIFFPRGSSSSPLTQKSSEAVPSSLPTTKPATSAEPAASQDRAAISDKTEAPAVGDDSAQANANKSGLRKNANTRNQNEQAGLPNPKSAAMSDEDKDGARTAEKAAPPVVPASERNSESRAEAPSPSETRPRTAQPSPQSNTDVKRQGSTASRSTPQSSNKKDDKEKKGGFLKVFKKIFGKD